MDRLDKFFKDKMNKREVAFDEAHWEAAQQMLDERDRRRKGVIWWWLVGLGCALLLFIVYIQTDLYTPNTKSEVSQGQPSVETPVQGDYLSTPQKINGSVPSEKEKNKKTPSVKIVEEPIAKVITPDLELSNKVSSTEKNTEQDDPIEETKSELDGSEISTRGLKKEGSKKEDAPFTSTNEDKVIVAIPFREEITDTKNDPLKLLKPEDRVANFDALPLNIQMIQLPLVSLPENNEVSYAENDRIEPQSSTRWMINAAGIYNPGDGKTAPGFSGNIQYTYPLNTTTGIYTTLGYSLLNGTFNPSKESNQEAYSFGLSVQRFQLTPDRLHYINGGIGIQKQWKRHTFKGGLIYRYLLGVQGSLSKSEKREFDLSFLDAGEEGSGWVDKDGFRSSIFGATLGYHLRILGPLELMINTQYFFDELLEKDYETPAGDLLQERGPVFIEFGLSYRL